MFLGAGKMATAIAGGLVKNGVFDTTELSGFDPFPAAAAAFSGATGVACRSEDPGSLVEEAECVLLAVKPQVLADAVRPLSSLLGEKLIVSIVAGVPISRIVKMTGSRRVVRVMPNTPALVGCGAAAYSGSEEATEADLAFAGKIFSAVGIAMATEERYLDAVTAVSGSGPAYVFEFIQALADGGVATGLSRDMATRLAVQTVLGAAEMVRSTGLHPTVLKDQVTSPAGTTIRALEVLESHAFAGTVIAAVRACAARSEELGRS